MAWGFILLWEHLVFCVLQEMDSFLYLPLCYKMLTHFNEYLMAWGFILLWEHLVFCVLQEMDSFVIPTRDKIS